MQDVLGLILGGGAGTRLYPLTKERAKPAVPLAGKYRLIDIPMSNCLHAGIDKIAILTQFNSVSLHRHIHRTYNRDVFSPGWVQILAAEQKPTSVDWYQGTADAVRKQSIEIKQAGAKYTLILAGDHLYRMDYRKFVEQHVESGSAITVAVQPVPRDVAPGLGILKLDEQNNIVEFKEKPKTDAELDSMMSWPGQERPFMASMGIYVFNTDVLFELLEGKGNDFGRDILPQAMDTHRLQGFIFEGYWEDIGTIQRFYQVNLDMALPDAPFDFYSATTPIYTRPRFMPASEVNGATLDNVLLTDGCRISKSTIRSAVIGLRSIIKANCTIDSTIIMGADFYESEATVAENAEKGIPDVGIGEGSNIAAAIIDKNARIGRNVTIRNLPDRVDGEGPNWVARDGIIIVPKNAILPDGTVI
ncbi:MAG: glucose-1-phosphate adenylyltransferase [Ardenticatenaceae bacterium]|nr:glucose-1-phosphate adenylyltransferase [Ardenticatenaceae bacterium]MCB8947418.1 glucose-1-phosphate adenylyltransferase [Ardenticatenaceae bacterium]